MNKDEYLKRLSHKLNELNIDGKEEILNDISLLSDVAIKTWFNEVGTDLFVEKKYEDLQNVLFSEDIYKENENLSLNR